MNKTILSFIILLMLQCPSFAQGLGVRAGLNLANFSGQDIADFDNRVGYHAGVFVPVAISDKVSIEPALLLSTKGAKFSGNESFAISPSAQATQEYSANITLSYLEVPVSLKYRLDEHFFLTAGPSFSFLLKKKGVFTERQCIDSECTGSQEKSEDFLDFRGSDIGLSAGLGFDLNDKLFLSATYQSGLLTLSKSKEDDKVFNKVWMFSVGYRIKK